MADSICLHYAVQLHDVSEDDLPIFFDHQLDPEATQMAAFPSRDRPVFMEHWHRVMANLAVDKRTIVVEGQVVGNVVSWEGSGNRFVGYWIGRSYWGRGIATEALSQFLGVVAARPLYAFVAKWVMMGSKNGC